MISLNNLLGRGIKRCYKVITVAVLTLICMGITYYSHFILKSDVVFTQLFFIPVILAGFWWGYKALWVSFILGSWMLGSILFSVNIQFSPNILRFIILVIVGFMVGKFKELMDTNQQLEASEQQLRAANQQLAASEQQLRANEKQLRTSNYDLNSRVRELGCLYNLYVLAAKKEGMLLKDIFQGVLDIIPSGWQYPDITCARINCNGEEYRTGNFKETSWKLTADISVNKKDKSTIEVFYIAEKPDAYEGPFLKREKELIDIIAKELKTAIRSVLIKESLWDSEEKWRLLVKNAPNIVIITDPAGVIQFANRPVPGQKNTENMEGKSIYKYLGREFGNAVKKTYDQIAGTGKPGSCEVMIQKPDGRDIWYYVNIGSVKRHKTITSMLLVITDITVYKEKEKMTKQLLTAQKMEAVGTLAGGIAHDFNNLLTGILGYTKLAMAQVKKEGRLYSDLEEIHLSAVRAADLTRQLLMFGRRQAISVEIYDVNKIVFNLLKMLRRLIGENISIKFIEQEGLWMIETDKVNIEQVIMNLAVNARDAMPKGGKIIIKTENIELKEEDLIDIPGGRKGNFVCLSVKDTGTGMDEETKKRLFEPFFTTKEVGKGTGLGLSVVYGVVEHHNGWVNILSEKGKGSEFKIFLPSSKEKSSHKTNDKSNKVQFNSKSETILFVEDEDVVRRFGTRVLEKNGYEVLQAASSTEALEIFNKNSGISVLVSDVVLPDTPGNELADILKNKKKNLKVVLCSGYSDKTINFKDLETKNYKFLNKPYSAEELLKEIK